MDGKRDSALLNAVIAMWQAEPRAGAESEASSPASTLSAASPAMRYAAARVAAAAAADAPPPEPPMPMPPPGPPGSGFFHPPQPPLLSIWPEGAPPSLPISSARAAVPVTVEVAAHPSLGLRRAVPEGVALPLPPTATFDPLQAQGCPSPLPLTSVGGGPAVASHRMVSSPVAPPTHLQRGLGIFDSIFQNGKEAVSRVDFARALEASYRAAGAAGQAAGQALGQAGRLFAPPAATALPSLAESPRAALLVAEAPLPAPAAGLVTFGLQLPSPCHGASASQFAEAAPMVSAPVPTASPLAWQLPPQAQQPSLSPQIASRGYAQQWPAQLVPTQASVNLQQQQDQYQYQYQQQFSAAQPWQQLQPEVSLQLHQGSLMQPPVQQQQPSLQSVVLQRSQTQWQSQTVDPQLQSQLLPAQQLQEAGSILAEQGAGASSFNSNRAADLLEKVNSSLGAATDSMNAVLATNARPDQSSNEGNRCFECRQHLLREMADLRQSVAQLQKEFAGLQEARICWVEPRYEASRQPFQDFLPLRSEPELAAVEGSYIWQGLDGLINTIEAFFGSLDGEDQEGYAYPRMGRNRDVLFELFDCLDEDGDGFVSRGDFHAAVAKLRQASADGIVRVSRAKPTQMAARQPLQLRPDPLLPIPRVQAEVAGERVQGGSEAAAPEPVEWSSVRTQTPHVVQSRTLGVMQPRRSVVGSVSVPPVAEHAADDASWVSTRTLSPSVARGIGKTSSLAYGAQVEPHASQTRRDFDRAQWLRARDMVESTNAKVSELIGLLKSTLAEILDERQHGRRRELDRAALEESVVRENAAVRTAIDQLRVELLALIRSEASFAGDRSADGPRRDLLEWAASRGCGQRYGGGVIDFGEFPRPPMVKIPEMHLPEVHMPKMPDFPEVHMPKMPDFPEVHMPKMPDLHLRDWLGFPKMPEIELLAVPNVADLLEGVPAMPKLYVPDTNNFWEGLRDILLQPEEGIGSMWKVDLNDGNSSKYEVAPESCRLEAEPLSMRSPTTAAAAASPSAVSEAATLHVGPAASPASACSWTTAVVSRKESHLA
eukprot:TRINITY_DN23207_c0_g2_i1.p1 TRINITY_DN23207_c0_g2~~TRINITY_DN23207_c0_g2_i1.p1  ORF type:complete len:1054 (-),score=239.50 TRINITY_DN23207_c0_g2_i1:63-3224(-)